MNQTQICMGRLTSAYKWEIDLQFESIDTNAYKPVTMTPFDRFPLRNAKLMNMEA